MRLENNYKEIIGNIKIYYKDDIFDQIRLEDCHSEKASTLFLLNK